MVNFGKLSINNYPLVQAWNGLTRRIQTTVEHMRVTNTEATPMARGHVIGLVAGQRRAEWANTGGGGNVEWCGVVTEPIPASGTGVARISGYAYCQFVALNPAPLTGEYAFLSATEGKLTNIPNDYPVGIIGNDTYYGTDVACEVFLNHCCYVGVQ